MKKLLIVFLLLFTAPLAAQAPLVGDMQVVAAAIKHPIKLSKRVANGEVYIPPSELNRLARAFTGPKQVNDVLNKVPATGDRRARVYKALELYLECPKAVVATPKKVKCPVVIRPDLSEVDLKGHNHNH